MKKLISVQLFLFVFLSCKEHDAELKQDSTTIITEVVSVPVKNDIELPPVSFPADIEALRFPGDTNPVRMVAFGGAFPAGFRDGGLYREGQLTSIPVLIAHQMQLATFNTPLFDKPEGNGSGYFLYDTTAPFPSWKHVTNNLGVLAQSPLTLSKYISPALIDNISWPRGPGVMSDSTNAHYSYPKQREYFSYLYRFYDKRGTWDRPFELFVDSTSRKTNLVLLFEDLDLWIGLASYTKFLELNPMLHEGYFYPKRQFILDNLYAGRKIVLFNQPDYLDFPFFHLYKAEMIKGKISVKGVALPDSSLLVPTDNVKRAFVSNDLTILDDSEVLAPVEIKQFKILMDPILNQNTTGAFAKQYNLPMVDMYALYKKILAMKYYTDDGLFVDPSFPNGNFFSGDGIHPTAIGSAVIANETIREINRVYKTKIPLINVRALDRRVRSL